MSSASEPSLGNEPTAEIPVGTPITRTSPLIPPRQQQSSLSKVGDKGSGLAIDASGGVALSAAANGCMTFEPIRPFYHPDGTFDQKIDGELLRSLQEGRNPEEALRLILGQSRYKILGLISPVNAVLATAVIMLGGAILLITINSSSTEPKVVKRQITKAEADSLLDKPIAADGGKPPKDLEQPIGPATEVAQREGFMEKEQLPAGKYIVFRKNGHVYGVKTTSGDLSEFFKNHGIQGTWHFVAEDGSEGAFRFPLLESESTYFHSAHLGAGSDVGLDTAPIAEHVNLVELPDCCILFTDGCYTVLLYGEDGEEGEQINFTDVQECRKYLQDIGMLDQLDGLRFHTVRSQGKGAEPGPVSTSFLSERASTAFHDDLRILQGIE